MSGEQVIQFAQPLGLAVAGQRECEAREAELKAELLKLKAVNDVRGEMRQRAALIVASEKAERRQ